MSSKQHSGSRKASVGTGLRKRTWCFNEFVSRGEVVLAGSRGGLRSAIAPTASQALSTGYIQYAPLIIIQLHAAGTTMRETEEVLSLDLEDNDYLYRIRRGKRVVYVSVLHADIIPLDHRTDGPRILSCLRCLPEWNEEWKTLTVTKSPNGVECTFNKFSPHALDHRAILTCADHRFNLLKLEHSERISDRISRVVVCGRVCVLKIARFQHELEALEKEIRAYGVLMNHRFSLVPEFIGFVYEEEENRVIGFLIEELHGRHPNIRDLRTCKYTVEQLHSIGIIHGDLNRYNIIITGHEAKLIDFEASTLQKEGHHEEATDELRKLTEKLLDSSEEGLR
ncbi:hypothetical protein V493_01676 [Pseudogymnoascus sp. VKM F-4281 (FW-2241)]|nr:hypothetical protein V493_01676 [Pseudogymnoascus sp. VKM F-4281 (FW-2241)]